MVFSALVFKVKDNLINILNGVNVSVIADVYEDENIEVETDGVKVGVRLGVRVGIREGVKDDERIVVVKDDVPKKHAND